MMVINSKRGSRQSSTVTTTTFADNTSAGDATVFIEGGASSARHPGYTKFTGSATAAEGTFLCGRAGKAVGGAVHFSDSSTAANGTFVLEGAVVADGRGGSVLFYDTSTAGNGVFTIDGTDVAAVGNGYMQFYDTSSAGNATLIANDGRVDGGEIDFFGDRVPAAPPVSSFSVRALSTSPTFKLEPPGRSVQSKVMGLFYSAAAS